MFRDEDVRGINTAPLMVQNVFSGSECPRPVQDCRELAIKTPPFPQESLEPVGYSEKSSPKYHPHHLQEEEGPGI